MALKPFEQFLFTASVYYKVYDKKSLALPTPAQTVIHIHYVAFANVKY
jgi:hypothetical protein